MSRHLSPGPAGALALLAVALMVIAWPWPYALHSDPSPHRSSLASARSAPVTSVLVPRRTVASIPVGDSPTLATYDPFNGYVYVVNSGARCGAPCGGSVSVLFGGTEIARLAIGTDAMGLLVDPQDCSWFFTTPTFTLIS